MAITSEQDIVNQIDTAAEAALERKGFKVVRLSVGEIIGITDYFLLFSARNDRQLNAIAEEVETQLREQYGRKPLAREGSAVAGWVVLDYGDYVIHGFLAETRDVYALDQLWSDVPAHAWEDVEPVSPTEPMATT